MSREYQLKRKYGITEEQYEDLLTRQANRCAVCGKNADYFKARLAVDHDHISGHVRGLLCPNCNRRVIGRYRKDKGLDLLRAAIKYLEAEYPGWIVPKKKKRKCRKKRKKLTKGQRKKRLKVGLLH